MLARKCRLIQFLISSRYQFAMSRLLTLKSIRKVANSIVTSQKSSFTEVVKSATVAPQYRFYSHYRHYSRVHDSYRVLNPTAGVLRSILSRNISSVAAGGTVKNHAFVAWKKLSQKCSSDERNRGAISIKNRMFNPKEGAFRRLFLRNVSSVSAGGMVKNRALVTWKRLLLKYSYNGRSGGSINKFAQAVCLALTRSHVVVPGVLAFTCGQVARNQTVFADADRFASANTMHMHAQDGRAYMKAFLFAAFEGAILLIRAIYLSILFTPSVVMAPFADSFGPEYRKLWLRVVHRTLERAGPAFIKWGQWAATRPDLFPKDLCKKLSELHMKAPEHSFAYTKKTIEKAFGRKLSEIFEIFEEEPVASGSIAQVHRAVLKYRYPGKEGKPMLVAVKVRHPGVGESIRRDFAIINTAAKISNLIPTLKWLRLDESVQQFAVFMMSQVDLAREAAHLSRFIYNFRNWKNVSFPKPIYPLVHPAVLVETYELGECISRYIDDELVGEDRVKAALAHLGTHALLKMLLVDNFIHADMHPGNILVRVPESKSSKKGLFKKKKPHLVFLDVGMTAELSRDDRVNLLEFFKAVARRDGVIAAESLLKLSKNQKCPDPGAFIEEVKKSFKFWGTPEGDIVHPAECMEQLLEKVRRHKVNIDGNVCTVMVTTLVLEGWQRKLDPGYNIMKTLQTVLLRADWAQSLSYTIDGLMAP